MTVGPANIGEAVFSYLDLVLASITKGSKHETLQTNHLLRCPLSNFAGLRCLSSVGQAEYWHQGGVGADDAFYSAGSVYSRVLQKMNSNRSVAIKVNVYKHDILAGLRGSCARCPTALAVRRAVKPRVRVSAGPMFLVMGTDTTPFYALNSRPTPWKVRRFILKFDSKKHTKESFLPFSFTIRIPLKLLRPRIKKAAILQPDGKVWTGKRHHNVIHEIVTKTGVRPVTGKQGFVLLTGEFVDRKVAMRLAFECGQIESLKKELFSEDLY